MTEIRISTNIPSVNRRFTKFRRRIGPRILLQLIGQRHLRFINDNFRRRGIERPWPPLAPNTLSNPRRGGRGAQPLRDRGRLSQSFVSRLRGFSAVEVGTNTEYAIFHEEGTSPFEIRPRGAKVLRFFTVDGPRFATKVSHPGIPARPMLPSRREGTRLARLTVEAAIRAAARRL